MRLLFIQILMMIISIWTTDIIGYQLVVCYNHSFSISCSLWLLLLQTSLFTLCISSTVVQSRARLGLNDRWSSSNLMFTFDITCLFTSTQHSSQSWRFLRVTTLHQPGKLHFYFPMLFSSSTLYFQLYLYPQSTEDLIFLR